MTKRISFQVVKSRKRRKTLTLKVDRDGKVVMHVPYYTSQVEIERFIKEKTDWLRKKLDEKEQHKHLASPARFLPGERFLYLGERYPLEYRPTNGRRALIALNHGVFYLDENHVRRAKELFAKWYKERAREIFEERVRYYSTKLKLYPADVKVTSARSRYGSCSAVNKLSFSFRLVMAPYAMIDYVILHELAHIKVKNHSKKFWDFMEEIMPDYKRRRKWLRDHSAMLDI